MITDTVGELITPDFVNGISVGGVCLLVLLGLTFDKGPLRLARELRTADERNKWLEARNEKQAEQISTLTTEIRTINQFLSSVRQAAEDKKP